MISDDQKKIVVDKLSELKPLRIGIFGSYARGDEKSTSDLDILVHLDYRHKISLLDLVRVQENLSETLGISVDLVTERSLSSYIKPYVTQDIQYILG
jgi:predicted nucleotidyltransferase